MLLAEVARAKALAGVVENARVVDASGEVVPLDRLREDGTIASDDEPTEESAADAATRPRTSRSPSPTEHGPPRSPRTPRR